MYQQKYSRVPNFFVTALQNLGAAPRKFIANPLGLSRYGDSPIGSMYAIYGNI